MSGPDALARSILESEDARILDIMKWGGFLKEVQQFAPEAKLLNEVHDEFRLEGVDYNDPHFKLHLEAFLADAVPDCEDPDCVVSEVHDR